MSRMMCSSPAGRLRRGSRFGAAPGVSLRDPSGPRANRMARPPATAIAWLVGTLGFLLCNSSAIAMPGASYVVLQQGEVTGEFAVEPFLTEPSAWPSASEDHPDGWSVVYRSQSPPPGWTRPFEQRGGGPAVRQGELNPRMHHALDEMLAARESGMAALLDAPDSSASYPGKPNPFPLSREGWLFIHDGYLDIEALTIGIWRDNLGDGWEAFKLDHPRDYNGNGDSTRGGAGEIYSLALLYEVLQAPDDVPRAWRRTLARLSVLEGWDQWQCNAVLQGEACTWAVRYALDRPERYPIYYGMTTAGEYCLSDTLPGTGGPWIEIPNLSLAIFPAVGAVMIEPIEISAVDPDLTADGRRPALLLRPSASPCWDEATLVFRLPSGASGRLEFFDLQGRLLDAVVVAGPASAYRWRPGADVPTGIILARLVGEGRSAHARILFLR